MLDTTAILWQSGIIVVIGNRMLRSRLIPENCSTSLHAPRVTFGAMPTTAPFAPTSPAT